MFVRVGADDARVPIFTAIHPTVGRVSYTAVETSLQLGVKSVNVGRVNTQLHSSSCNVKVILRRSSVLSSNWRAVDRSILLAHKHSCYLSTPKHGGVHDLEARCCLLPQVLVHRIGRRKQRACQCLAL